MTQAPLITEEYRRMQEELHQNPNYGVASVHYAPVVAKLLKQYGATELLDYGSGKGRLAQALDELTPELVTLHQYDPAISEWSDPPEPCDFVACIDVLEHVEPELLENVLDDLKRVTAHVGVFTVHTGAALKELGDGRNAHLIQKPVAWWLPKLLERFELMTFVREPSGFWVVVMRKAD